MYLPDRDYTREGVTLRCERTWVSPVSIYDAILGSRLSYGSGNRSDSVLENGVLTLGEEDRTFIQQRIAKGISGEDKLLRTIPVSVMITAPLGFVLELDTYKVGTVKQSNSLMHYFKKNGAPPVSRFTADTDLRSIQICQNHFDAWAESNEPTNSTSALWRKFQDSVPRGILYTFHWTANYAVLRNIFRQRKMHRQLSWRVFCDEWMGELPCSWIFSYRV